MIDGIKVQIGPEEFTAAPLNFKALKKFGPLIDEFGGGRRTSLADLPMLQDVIAASIRRNHPDVSDDFFDEWIDTKNVSIILGTVMRASGVGDAVPGEQKPIAEAGQTTIGEKSTST